LSDIGTSLPEDRISDFYYIIGLVFLPLFWLFPYWLHPMGVGDNIVGVQPHYGYLFQMVRSFRDPLWDPFLLSGFPISGYPNASVYNLFAWLYFFLPVRVAGNVQILITYSVGSVGFYLFGRAMGLDRAGSFLSGVIYSAATYGLSSFASILAYGGFAWGGWILACLEKLRQARGIEARSRWTFLLAMTAALQLMAGHPHNFQHTCIFAGIYILFVALAREGGKSRWAWIGCSLIALALALGLALAVILPELELQQLSWRRELPFDKFVIVQFNIRELLGGMIFPAVFPRSLRVPYLGAAFCALAGYGALKRINDARYKALLLITFISMLLMMGDNTPLPALLYKIPGFNMIGSSNRYRTEFAYAVAILAGTGLGHLLKTEILPAAKWLIALLAVAAVGTAASVPGGPLEIKPMVLEVLAAGFIFLTLYLRKTTGKSRWLLLGLAAFLTIPNYYVSWYYQSPNARFDPAQSPPVLKHVPNQKGNGKPPPRTLPVVDISKSGMKLIYRLGAQNFSELHGIHNAAGYLPLMSKRYGELLDMDYMGFPRDLRKLITPPALIPKILDIQSIIIPGEYIRENFSRLYTSPEVVQVGDVPFLEEFFITLKAGEDYSFEFPEERIAGIGLVTNMYNASHVSQGEEVLSVLLEGRGAATREVRLKAGVDTSAANYRKTDSGDRVLLKVGDVPFRYNVDTVISPGDETSLYFHNYEATGLAMVSYLFIARDVPQGEEVAKITVVTEKSGELNFPVRAGIESSEWSIEYKREEVPHRRAFAVEDFRDQRGVIGHKYFARFEFDRPVKVKRVDIEVHSRGQKTGLNLNNLALIGTDGGYAEGSLPHKAASIFPRKSTRDNIREAYHLYYTIRRFEEPIVANSCTFKCLLESEYSGFNIRGMTLLRPPPQEHLPLSYIHHMLGQPELYERIDTPEAYIWRTKKPTPRAWLTSRALWLKPDKILDALRSGMLPNGEKFDPYSTALLEREEDQPFFLLRGENLRGDAEIDYYSSNEIRLFARCDRTCLLVVSEKYYPGWEARVDGERTPIYKTDYVLRGVLLKPGDHRVVLEYKPSTVKLGRIASLSTLLLIIISWIGIHKFASGKAGPD